MKPLILFFFGFCICLANAIDPDKENLAEILSSGTNAQAVKVDAPYIRTRRCGKGKASEKARTPKGG